MEADQDETRGLQRIVAQPTTFVLQDDADGWEIRPRNGGFDANAAMADDPALHGVEYGTWVPIMRREVTDDMMAAGASALALEDDYNPNDFEPKHWPKIRGRYELCARIILEAALGAGREQA